LLEPGSTCWRSARAQRIAVLVDTDAYFSALREAILAAEHSIHIVGWDVDTRTVLTPEQRPRDGFPAPLLDFLNAVLEHKPQLRAHVLAWDFSAIYLLERELLPSYKFNTQAHPRLSFALDGQHQVGASHHQKLVVIDDRLAFCGGMDLTIRRWDTPAHAATDARRVDPGGEPYAPMHDVQLAVDGEAAEALAELVRLRWHRATGQAPEPAPRPTHARPDLWPRSMGVDVTDVDVAIVRTEPTFSESHRDVREIQQLTVRAIQSARSSIFIENQYLTAAVVGDALIERLGEPNGPEVVVILPKMECGWLEQSSMGVLRERMLRKLRAADRHQRLHVYYPVVPGLAGDTCVNVHSKVLIVDDHFLKVGSSNLSNRSLGLDTECDLAVEAPADSAGTRVTAQIARVKYRLLGEHLGLSPEEVAERVAQVGSVARVVEARRGAPRCLEPLPDDADPPLDLSVLEEFFVDPEHPMGADAFINTLMPIELQRPVPRSLTALAIMLAPLTLIGVLWHNQEMASWELMRSVGDVLDIMRDSPFSALYVAAGFVAMGLLLCPLTILITFSLLAFGPAEGCLYAMLGSLSSSTSSYWLGRVIGHVPLRRVYGPRMSKLRAALRKRAFRATTAARLLPLGNFTAINLLAGALYVPFLHFTAGNLVGLTPGMLGMALFAKQLELTVKVPTGINLILLVLCGVALAGSLWLLGLLLGDSMEERPRRSVYSQRTAP
jgi:phosphatidylserine/phosphatidylglycerophosphate/cardiolipin synthase-like enzyme/uncharacterized membrane protein YdjX (TVP38/TMEM64 family)